MAFRVPSKFLSSGEFPCALWYGILSKYIYALTFAASIIEDPVRGRVFWNFYRAYGFHPKFNTQLGDSTAATPTQIRVSSSACEMLPSGSQPYQECCIPRTAVRQFASSAWLENAASRNCRSRQRAVAARGGSLRSFLWLHHPPPWPGTLQSALLHGDTFLNLPIMFNSMSAESSGLQDVSNRPKCLK